MLKCPPYSPSIEARQSAWEKSVSEYVFSDALSELLGLFNANITGETLQSRIGQIRAFAKERWDYRRKSGSGERWTVQDEDPIVISNIETILDCARRLGMIGVKSQRNDGDYIMPLGGARAANLDRVQEAKRLLDLSEKQAPVIALTAKRPLGEIEIPYVADYVDGACAKTTTEFDVMCRAMETTLGTPATGHEGEEVENAPNLGWAINHYGRHCVVCAPSSDPEHRRANTADTLQFFQDRFAPEPGSVLLLTTSSIYVSYQTASLVPLALKHGWEIELSGSGDANQHNDVISNYLQEIKGTIEAIASSLGI